MDGKGGRLSVRIGIGDFYLMTHLSIKALRHYHDIGVLVPAYVDPFSGYRFYEADQAPAAQVIRRLRDLGMPLQQIASVLMASDLRRRNELIAEHLARMEEQLAHHQAVVSSLRSLLDRREA